MAPEATIGALGKSSGNKDIRVRFKAIHIDPAGGAKDTDGRTDIYAHGGSDEARTALVDGILKSARILPGESEDALTLDGEPVKKVSREQILPEKADVHLS